MSAELRAKLARASDLMRHANPSGDVATVVDRALDLLVAKLEKERFAKSTRPRTTTRASAGRGSAEGGPRKLVVSAETLLREALAVLT